MRGEVYWTEVYWNRRALGGAARLLSAAIEKDVWVAFDGFNGWPTGIGAALNSLQAGGCAPAMRRFGKSYFTTIRLSANPHLWTPPR